MSSSSSWRVTSEPTPASEATNLSVTGVYFHYNSDSETVRPLRELNGRAGASVDAEKPTRHSLDVKGVSYTVKYREGAWWRGACLRKQQQRHILRDVTLRVNSGSVTAVLGNSGKQTQSQLNRATTTTVDIVLSSRLRQDFAARRHRSANSLTVRGRSDVQRATCDVTSLPQKCRIRRTGRQVH